MALKMFSDSASSLNVVRTSFPATVLRYLITEIEKVLPDFETLMKQLCGLSQFNN